MKVIYDAFQGQATLLTPQFTRRRPSESNKVRVTAWGLGSLGRAEALPREWQLKAKLRSVPMSVAAQLVAQPNSILVKCYQVHWKAAALAQQSSF